MTHQTTLIYSQSLLLRAVWRFWWRTVSKRFLIPGVLIGTVLAFELAGGNRSWLVGVLASALVLGAIFPLAIFVAHYRNALQSWQAMGEPRARFIASDRTFKLSTGAGISTLPWTSVREVWQFPDFWLVLFSRAQFATLPLAGIEPEVRAFMVERVQAAGGKIR